MVQGFTFLGVGRKLILGMDGHGRGRQYALADRMFQGPILLLSCSGNALPALRWSPGNRGTQRRLPDRPLTGAAFVSVLCVRCWRPLLEGFLPGYVRVPRRSSWRCPPLAAVGSAGLMDVSMSTGPFRGHPHPLRHHGVDRVLVAGDPGSVAMAWGTLAHAMVLLPPCDGSDRRIDPDLR